MNRRAPIFLLTDFGGSDPYVGVMKAVILARAPEAAIVDLGHEISPQDVRSAAFQLMAAAPFLPPGSIVAAVVDPGVGSSRRILWARSAERQYLAPDNGLLDWVAHEEPFLETREVSARELWLDEVSSTFHGRDIFAPVAAALSRGLPAARLGKRVTFRPRVPFPEPVRVGGGWRGVVLAVDRFGNAVTNFKTSGLKPGVRLRYRAKDLGPVRRSYSEVRVGQALAAAGSWGFVELAIREGSFAGRRGARPGDAVHVR